MKVQALRTGFFGVLLLHLLGILASQEMVQALTKPLIVPLLIAYFLSGTGTVHSPLKKWVVLALLFSWVGDVLLLFQGRDSLFFLLGLSSFLLAHIFYILFFHGVRTAEGIKRKLVPVLIVLIYYVVLMLLLAPGLHDMAIPVRIYGIVISFMFMLAMHMLSLGNRKAGWLLMSGALLFVISDSLLAFNKFYQPFPYAGAWTMLSYGLAQWFITDGVVRYLVSLKK